jgi:hypothetical protein
MQIRSTTCGRYAEPVIRRKLSLTNKQRAGCGESRKPGSEGGVGKQARDHIGQPKRPAPTLHYKVWLAAQQRYFWDDIFYRKPPHVRKVLQEEITALRYEHGEEIWFNTFAAWVSALRQIVGVQCAGIAVTDLGFLIEMPGMKSMGGKILLLEAPDQQANVAPELRGHRSETELDSPQVLELRDAYSQHPPPSMATRLRAAGELP